MENKPTINSLMTHKPHLKMFKNCTECNRIIFSEINANCYQCCKLRSIPLSGNKVVDDFIRRYTLVNGEVCIEFVPFDKFKDVKYIGEGGFSRVYSATWKEGPIANWNDEKQKYARHGKITVALKELNESKNISPKELNEVRYFTPIQIIKSRCKSLVY